MTHIVFPICAESRPIAKRAGGLEQSDHPHPPWRQKVDPSAAPPPLFRLARTKSGWRAGAPTKIRLAAAGDFSGGGGGGIRRDLVNGGTSHY